MAAAKQCDNCGALYSYNESREMSEEIAALKSDCRALGNRCFTMTQGSMCMFCNLSTMECPHVLNDDQKIKIAKKLMEESK